MDHIQAAKTLIWENDIDFQKAILNSLVDNWPDGLLVISDDLQIITYNKTFIEIWGITEDMAELNIINNKLVDSYKFIKEEKKLPILNKNYEIIHLKDGRIFEWSNIAIDVPEKAFKGQVWFFIDITLREKSHQEIMTMGKHLLLAQKISHMGSWEWDIINNSITWSDATYDIFGVKKDEFGTTFTYEKFESLIHPDDKELLTKAIAEARDAKVDFDIHLKIIRPDQSVRTIHSIGVSILDNNKEVVKMFGTAHDVTEQREADAKLQQRTRELEDLNQAMVNRELKMAELKKELEALKAQNGISPTNPSTTPPSTFTEA